MPLLTPVYGGYESIESIKGRIGQDNAVVAPEPVLGEPSFLDVFKGIAAAAVETGQQKAADAVDLMLGNTDDIEAIQTNIAKAEFANDLLVTVKNTVVEAYNEIIKMSI